MIKPKPKHRPCDHGNPQPWLCACGAWVSRKTRAEERLIAAAQSFTFHSSQVEFDGLARAARAVAKEREKGKKT